MADLSQDGPYRARRDAPDDEKDPLEIGALQTFDVFALIVNKMIGTGIFSAPATVFMLTGRKWLTLMLFAIGFVYSLLSTVMYLDYASVWPYTGGELVYVDEITAHEVEYPAEEPIRRNSDRSEDTIQGSSTLQLNEIATVMSDGIELTTGSATAQPTVTGIHENANVVPATPRRTWGRRFFGDGLLPFVTFSVLFVGIFNSGTNSMQTGRMILMCIVAKEPGNPDVHRDVVRLFGVLVLTILSLLQYFSARFGRKLNRFLAVIKLLFLVALVLTAMVALKHQLANPDGTVVDRKEDWYRAYPVSSELHFAKALLAVLFSFDGWENATFVVGELPRTGHQRELRNGFYSAVITVGCFYLIVVGIVLNSLTWEEINTENVYYAPLLTGNGSAAKLAWSIAGAVSALGNLNAVIYTFSRVKQAIGQADILPWSRVWKKDDILQRDPRIDDTIDTSTKKTPQGGLILHWIFSTVVIAGSSWISSTIESVSVPSFIQVYAHCFILTILGLGYHRLRRREEALTPPSRGPTRVATAPDGRFQPYKWTQSVPRKFRVVSVVAYIGLNLSILVINPIPPYKGSDGTPNSFPGYAFLVTVVALVLFSVLYYITIFGAAKRISPSSRRPGAPRVEEEALLSPHSKLNLMQLANVRVEITKDRYFNPRLERVYRFGRRWRISFDVDENDQVADQIGQDSQHPPLTWATFLYWLFGGSRLIDTPAQKVGRWWDRWNFSDSPLHPWNSAIDIRERQMQERE